MLPNPLARTALLSKQARRACPVHHPNLIGSIDTTYQVIGSMNGTKPLGEGLRGSGQIRYRIAILPNVAERGVLETQSLVGPNCFPGSLG